MSEHEGEEDRLASFQREALPHLDAVFRFALRLTGEDDQAQDLVQDTFLRAQKAWAQYESGTHCKSWLFTICRNAFLKGKERGQRHDEIVAASTGQELEGVEPVSPIWASVSEVDPEGKFFGSIVDETVLRAIEGLAEEFRTAVVLSDFEGLAYGEIAEILGVPVGTVKSRLFRGRRLLQKVLYDYAVEMGHVRPTKGKEDGSTSEKGT